LGSATPCSKKLVRLCRAMPTPPIAGSILAEERIYRRLQARGANLVSSHRTLENRRSSWGTRSVQAENCAKHGEGVDLMRNLGDLVG
jgi:hypothetical protein